MASSSSESVRAESMNDLDMMNPPQSRDANVDTREVADPALPLPDQPNQKCLSLESVHEDAKVFLGF